MKQAALSEETYAELQRRAKTAGVSPNGYLTAMFSDPSTPTVHAKLVSSMQNFCVSCDLACLLTQREKDIIAFALERKWKVVRQMLEELG